jgi:hypothetical protein
MSSYDDRLKRLNNFNETFRKELDNTMQQEQEHIRQYNIRQFNYHLEQAQACAKSGDMVNAYLHKIQADSINIFLKGFEHQET